MRGAFRADPSWVTLWKLYDEGISEFYLVGQLIRQLSQAASCLQSYPYA